MAHKLQQRNLGKSALVRLRLKLVFGFQLIMRSLNHPIEMHALFQGQLFMSQLWLSQLSIHKTVDICPFWTKKKKKTFRRLRSLKNLPMNRLVKGYTHEMFSPYLYVELSPTFSLSFAHLENQDRKAHTKNHLPLFSTFLRIFPRGDSPLSSLKSEFYFRVNFALNMFCLLNYKFCYQFNRVYWTH